MCDRETAAAENERRVYERLAALNIKYERKEHPAVFTTEEAERLCTDLPGLKVKNLFVKDKKTMKYFLVLLQDERRLDFKGLGGATGWKKPTFGTPEELWERLKLTPGSVSVFGLINDADHRVTVVLDRLLSEEAPDTPINFHPCVNTATIAVSLADFFRFLEDCGNPVVCEEKALSHFGDEGKTTSNSNNTSKNFDVL